MLNARRHYDPQWPWGPWSFTFDRQLWHPDDGQRSSRAERAWFPIAGATSGISVIGEGTPAQCALAMLVMVEEALLDDYRAMLPIRWGAPC